MAERLHRQRKTGGPHQAARDAFAMFNTAPFLWRAPVAVNDNPAPMGKKLARAAKLVLLLLVLGLLAYASIHHR